MGAREAIAVGATSVERLRRSTRAGLIHGDVKAQNVMREEGGRIVLMDFGAGQAQGAPTAKTGTPLYLAPEVLAAARRPRRATSTALASSCSTSSRTGIRCPRQTSMVSGRRTRRGSASACAISVPISLVRSWRPWSARSRPDPAPRFPTAGAMERALAESSARPRPWRYAAALAAAAALVALVAALPPLTRALWGPKIQSIAVLPFSVPATDDAAHLVSGLASDVVRELQRFDLEVKRASTTGPGTDPAALERRLDADATLQGSSSRVDGKPAPRCCRPRGRIELWSKDYALEGETLPSLARTISREAAASLRLRVRPGAPSAGHQANYKAYDAYQRGRALSERRTETDLTRSLDMPRRPRRLDPEFAEPWAGMADAYMALGVPPFGSLRPLEARRLAKEAALEALNRNPNLPEAHTSLAFAAFLHDWDWQRRRGAFQTGDRTQSPVRARPSLVRQLPQRDGAIRLRRWPRSAAHRRSSRCRSSSTATSAWHLFFQRRYDEAIAQLEQTLGMDAGYGAARTLLARALAERGRYPEALEHLRLAAPTMPAGTNLAFVAYVEADLR